MTFLLVACLLQAPEPTIDDRIAAFVKGDAAARAELVKLGIFAIRPLQKARKQSPEKIDALVYDLKKAAAHPQDSWVIADLANKVRFKFQGELREANFVVLLDRQGPQVFLDAWKQEDVKTPRVDINVEDRPVREIFDQICAQTGLDYAVFHNVVVIGTPERLWPPGPPPAPKPLTAEETARARALVEKLKDEAIDVRESATRALFGMGVSILPILDEQAKRGEGDLGARCAAVASRLRKPSKGVFGPSGFERQKRSADQEALFESMKDRTVTWRFKDLSSSYVGGLLTGLVEVPVQIPKEWGDLPFSIGLDKVRSLDLFCLVAQSKGLDFVFRDGGFRLEPQERIEEFLLAR